MNNLEREDKSLHMTMLLMKVAQNVLVKRSDSESWRQILDHLY